MSKKKLEKKEIIAVEPSGKSKDLKKNQNISSSFDSSAKKDESLTNSSEAANVKVLESEKRRPRGRPPKNRKNSISTTENSKECPKSEQSSSLSTKTINEKKVDTSNTNIQKSIPKIDSKQANQNSGLNNDNPPKKHRAKNGNIHYKNIRSINNDKSASSSNLISKTSSISDSSFNFIATHSRLETIETRINDSQIPEMIHPAQSIVYDRLHQESLSLNSKEYEKRRNYRIIETKKRIPSCWDPKPWDKEEEKMTEFENIEFAEMIKRLEPCNSEGEIIEWYKSKNVRSGTKQRKKRPKINFVASLINFSTDDFDDQTDFDFYE